MPEVRTEVQTEELAWRVERAALAIGVSRSKCYELIARGEIPALKVGASWRVPVAGLRAWIDERAAASGGGRDSEADAR